MSEFGAEHGVDDPVEDPSTEGRVAAGEHHPDAAAVSEETGTRYASDGDTEATPEDEERFRTEGEA